MPRPAWWPAARFPACRPAPARARPHRVAADEIDQSLLQTIVGNESDILAMKAASGALDAQRCQIPEKGRKRSALKVDGIERNTAQSDIAKSSDSDAAAG